VNGAVLPLQQTYADVAPGTVIALCGSTGLIEIAVREGSAARELGLRRGSSVLFRPLGR
jgi:S-adenosylmethionine hydrolase